MNMARIWWSIMKQAVMRIAVMYEMCMYDRFTYAKYLRKKGMKIGESCSIFPLQGSTEPYLITIGNHVTIAEGVTLMTHDGGAWIFREEDPNMQVFGPITIEDNCVIGERAIILPNVRIGKNSIVGAGSVVISDVPPDSIVMGVPARVFGSVDKYKEKCLEHWHEQRPPDCIIEEGKTWWTSQHFQENREKIKRHLLKLFRGVE